MYTGRMIHELMAMVDEVRERAELREQAELEFKFSPLEEIEAEQCEYEMELAGVA